MEQLKHECGVALIRLKKPVSYYAERYGTSRWAMEKLYLMMEKQHNRGQEGAGIATVSLDSPAGEEYMYRERAEGKDAITEVFEKIENGSLKMEDGGGSYSQSSILNSQLFMGHLRYSTTGRSGIQYVHPFMRRSGWRATNLCLCGNFNMTNMDEVFRALTEQGLSPRSKGDGHVTLELMGHYLDKEVEDCSQSNSSKVQKFKSSKVQESKAEKVPVPVSKVQGLKGSELTRYIEEHVDMANVLRNTMKLYDGGYVMCGMTGSGEMFAMRDPWGIRTAYWYEDDEVAVVASERAVIQTTFNVGYDEVRELNPGEALIIRKGGKSHTEQVLAAAEQKRACSFERIYFSRGSDRDIYRERKRLGELLAPPIMRAIGGDVQHTVFSYIPNTAEVAFHGMVEGVRKLTGTGTGTITGTGTGSELCSPEHLWSARTMIRAEKVVWKDIKLRTFISGADERKAWAAHVYDVTYGSITSHEDNLVVIDDSIVRGTTLSESILRMLDRLSARKIVMVSSAPQIRYPDYYGIDMPRLEELCMFRAAMALIREQGMEAIASEVYDRCLNEPDAANHVRTIYAPFSVEELNQKAMEMLKPEGMRTPVELVFQSIEGLHEACPDHKGDWYFTGHYPTKGGTRLVNRAFAEYYDKVAPSLLA